MTLLPGNLDALVSEAVAHFWRIRNAQTASQAKRGKLDQGLRSAVTGGAQLDGFVSLIARIVSNAGVDDAKVFRKQSMELPGYFRPTKEWDIVVVVDGQLLAAVEAKSQVGPSFGNNFNNRTEEAIGSAVDLWTAFREGAYRASARPWLGYLFLLEECPRSLAPIRVKEPHFPVFPEFQGASYAKRYELLCRKLVLERHYEAAALLMADGSGGARGEYNEPATDLSFRQFAGSLAGHVAGIASQNKDRPRPS
jgi:hypothetical protein